MLLRPCSVLIIKSPEVRHPFSAPPSFRIRHLCATFPLPRHTFFKIMLQQQPHTDTPPSSLPFKASSFLRKSIFVRGRDFERSVGGIGKRGGFSDEAAASPPLLFRCQSGSTAWALSFPPLPPSRQSIHNCLDAPSPSPPSLSPVLWDSHPRTLSAAHKTHSPPQSFTAISPNFLPFLFFHARQIISTPSSSQHTCVMLFLSPFLGSAVF